MPNAVTTEKLYALAAAAQEKGLGLQVTSDDRTYQQQAALGQSNNAYPVASAGTSQHEYGFAFDAVPIPDTPANRKKLGALAPKVGLVYGGSADPVHFQLFSKSDWRVILQAPSLLNAFQAKKQAIKYKGRVFNAPPAQITAVNAPQGSIGTPAGGIRLPSPNSGGSAVYNPSLSQMIQNVWDAIVGGKGDIATAVQNFVSFKGVLFPPTIPGLVQGYQPRTYQPVLPLGLPYQGSSDSGGAVRLTVDSGGTVIITTDVGAGSAQPSGSIGEGYGTTISPNNPTGGGGQSGFDTGVET